MTPGAAVHALLSMVFVWQLWGAARVFRPMAGSRMGVVSLVVPLAFVVILARSRSVDLNPWTVVPGCLGEVGAVALFQWASRAVEDRYFSYIFSDDTPLLLCREGPFAYIRNPFYTSYLLAYGSAVAMFPDAVSGAVLAGMTAYYWAAAVFEERKFERSPLAPEYADYKARTGRFLPRLLRREPQ